MEFQISGKAEKKSKFSFLLHLRGFSRKSKQTEQDPDVTLTAAKRLYSSFRHGASKTSSTTVDSTFHPNHDENYVTLENSDLSNVHKDAGILFLSSENKFQWNQDEKRKHVQFAPTPLNKYYNAEKLKSSPAMQKSIEGKENRITCHPRTAAPPILKNSGGKHISIRNSTNGVNALAHVRYDPAVDKKNPFPRTSTRSVLSEQKNMSLPRLNVSTIIEDYDQTFTAASKCSSLGRKQLLTRPNLNSSSGFQNNHHSYQHCDANAQSVSLHRVSFANSPLKKVMFVDVNNAGYSHEDNTDAANYSGTKDRVYYTNNPHKDRVCPQYLDVRQKIPDLGTYSVSHTVNGNSTRNEMLDIQKSQKVDAGAHDCMPRSGSLKSVKSQQGTELQVSSLKTTKSFRNKGTNFDYLKLPAMQSKDQPRICSEICSKNLTSHAAPRNVRQFEVDCVRYRTSTNNSRMSYGATMSNVEPHLKVHQAPETQSSQLKNNQITKRSSKYLTQPRKDCSSGVYLSTEVVREATASKPLKLQDIPACDFGHDCVGLQKYNNAKYIGRKPSKSCSFCRKDHFQRQAGENIVLTSSPKNSKRMEFRKSCKYQRWLQDDCMSTLADDECSLNCSCAGCMPQFDEQSMVEEFNYAKDQQDKVKYFFPHYDSEILPTIQGKPQHPLQKLNFENYIRKSTHLSKTNDFLHHSHVNANVEKNEVKHTYRNKASGDSISTSANFNRNGVLETKNGGVSLKTEPNIPFRTRHSGISTECNDSPIYINMDKYRSNNNETIGNNEASNSFKEHHNECITPSIQIALIAPSGAQKLNDSYIILLQENFQKVLQNFGDLFKPHTDSNENSGDSSTKIKIGNKTRLSPAKVQSKLNDATHLDTTASNVSVEKKPESPTSTKDRPVHFTRSQSLPGLSKEHHEKHEFRHSSLLSQPHHGSLDSKEWDSIQREEKRKGIYFPDSSKKDFVINGSSSLSSRHSPDGWEKTPSTDNNSAYTTVSACSSTSKCTRENLQTDSSDNASVILEEVKRIGMGFSPAQRIKKLAVNSKSPIKYKFKAKEILSGKAKLKLSIYNNSGLVTIHVVKAANLSSLRTLNLNPYVKVSLQPDDTRRAHWRTSVVQNQNNPDFNQKFSFEILPEDTKKRLIFSVWHRDVMKKRSEFIGCMSFGVHHVMDTTHCLNGWYRLLKEVVGIQKHFAAHHRKIKIASKALEIK